MIGECGAKEGDFGGSGGTSSPFMPFAKPSMLCGSSTSAFGVGDKNVLELLLLSEWNMPFELPLG